MSSAMGYKEFPGSFKDENEPNKLKINYFSTKKQKLTHHGKSTIIQLKKFAHWEDVYSWRIIYQIQNHSFLYSAQANNQGKIIGRRRIFLTLLERASGHSPLLIFNFDSLLFE